MNFCSQVHFALRGVHEWIAASLHEKRPGPAWAAAAMRGLRTRGRDRRRSMPSPQKAAPHLIHLQFYGDDFGADARLSKRSIATCGEREPVSAPLGWSRSDRRWPWFRSRASRRQLSGVLQGIITGVGFIGGGSILRDAKADEVPGFTTAATVW